MNKKITVNDFREKKKMGEKITALTAYDKKTAELMSELGLDLILVGDSLGMVVLGYETTIPVTLDEMLHHTKAVMRGAKGPFTCIDMPFMSYQTDIYEALTNCGRAVKETGVESVKIEGCHPELITWLVKIGIPVLGHTGFIPQSYHALGGYRIVGKHTDEALSVIEDAREIERAGAFAVVLECVPEEVAGMITDELSIPTIGIGSGALCDGQILVINDILGLFEPAPKHVKVYARVDKMIKRAVGEYIEEVRNGGFPSEEHSYRMDENELKGLKEKPKGRKR